MIVVHNIAYHFLVLLFFPENMLSLNEYSYCMEQNILKTINAFRDNECVYC